MKALYFLILLPIVNLTSQSDSSLTFSEVMFHTGSETGNEFIEIYNLSETDTIDLSTYKIKYYTSNPHNIIDAGFGTFLTPKSFAIILPNNYDFSTGIYSALIPETALRLHINRASFGTSGMANTSDRGIWLLNSQNDTIDHYTYSANNTTYISDEKIVMNKDNSNSNWSNSKVQYGTPGFRNSITPLKYDLIVKGISISPQIPFFGDDIFAKVTIKNNGTETADTFIVKIYLDENKDSVGTNDELIYSEEKYLLESEDSLELSVLLQYLESGNYQIIAEVFFLIDENPVNNISIKKFTVHTPSLLYNDIVINEIMYAPSGGEPEWVELFNRTDETVNLKKWKFADNVTTVTITNDEFYIQPKSFLLLSRDSSIFNYHNIDVPVIVFNLPVLNNTGDACVLKDSIGVVIDSVNYFSSWGGSSGGRSLERISVEGESNKQSNWGTSMSPFKGTPGKINSLTPKDYDLSISEFKPKKPFVVIGEESIELIIKIQNRGKLSSNNFTLNIFYDVNADSITNQEEIIFIYEGNSILQDDTVVVNFLFNDYIEGKNYFVVDLKTIPDDDTLNNKAYTVVTGVVASIKRNDLIINEIMYAPRSPEPEWIEIFNRSDETINLYKFKLADNRDTTEVIRMPIELEPSEYLVVAKDSTVISKYNIKTKVVVRNFPILNNNFDSVILIDSLNRTIDSLEFNSSWGGTSGLSLERINPDLSSIDSINWGSSKNKFGATPGIINSLSEKDYDVIVKNIFFSPPYPLYGENISISVEIENAGRETALFKIELFEDIDNDSIPDLHLESIENLLLQSKETSVYSFNYEVQNIQQEKYFYVRAVYTSDEDTTNNSIINSLIPGYPVNTIVANEIMYMPLGGEPEWIELYNKSSDSINLKNWSVSDVITTPSKVKINQDAVIPPEGYLVLAKDNSIYDYHFIIPSQVIIINLPVLNNDRDGVVITDNRGLTIDSVFYYKEWGGINGFSLERISVSALANIASNWKTSIDIEQSTPGRVNSLTPKLYDLSITEIITNPRFPVEGDNITISAEVKNYGGLTAETFSVEFYYKNEIDSIFIMLDKQISNNLQPDETVVVISIKQLENIYQKMTIGVRIIFQSDEDTLNNYREKIIEPGFRVQSLLINEIMYAPQSGEPEWIEFINVSNDTINLKNWSVSDILPSPKRGIISEEDLLLHPNEFLIIAQDSSFFNHFQNVNTVIKVSQFGNLSNITDGIMVCDFRDAVIDSLIYKSSWGGQNGRSLERVSFEKSSADSSNWVTSLSPFKSTPGKENSIYSIPTYNRNTLVINEIMYDPSPGNCEFIEFLNISSDTVNIGGWRFEDEKGSFYKLSDTSFILPPGEYFLITADSSIINYYPDIYLHPYLTIVNRSNLGLVNNGELILLKDVRGNTIDSVWYSNKWHNRNLNVTKDKSLERINPFLNSNDQSNWSSSVSPFGATPASVNSIYTLLEKRTAEISVSPNPFSPDNDGFEDHTIISFKLKDAVSQIRIKIYDSKGRLLRTIVNNQPVSSSGNILYDGLDDYGNPLRIGIYIVFLEAIGNSGVVQTLKTPVVIARKLR